MKNCFYVQMPLLQRPFAAFCFAFVAGCLDAYAFSTTSSFASFQSGNVIVLIYHLSIDFAKASPYLFSILSFLLGTAFLEVFKQLFSKNWSFRVVAFEVFILFSLLAYARFFQIEQKNIPLYFSWIISFVAGVQGAAFHKIGSLSYRSVAMTSTMQNAVTFFIQKLFGIKVKSLNMYLYIFASFVLGALCVVFSLNILEEWALLFALFPLALLLSLGSFQNKSLD